MYLSDIKTAKRIGHNALDAEIQRLEDVCRAELVRAGVPKEQTILGESVEEENPMIKQCIITGVLAELSGSADYPRYREAFLYQADCLRKHEWADPEEDPEDDPETNPETGTGPEGETDGE